MSATSHHDDDRLSELENEIEAEVREMEQRLQTLTEEWRTLEADLQAHRKVLKRTRALLRKINGQSEEPKGRLRRPPNSSGKLKRHPRGRHRDLCARLLASVYPEGLSSAEIVERRQQQGDQVNRKSVSSALSTLKSMDLATLEGGKYKLTDAGMREFEDIPGRGEQMSGAAGKATQ